MRFKGVHVTLQIKIILAETSFYSGTQFDVIAQKEIYIAMQLETDHDPRKGRHRRGIPQNVSTISHSVLSTSLFFRFVEPS